MFGRDELRENEIEAFPMNIKIDHHEPSTGRYSEYKEAQLK